MNKAVLLSAFAYPGSGHILLKKYWTGISLIIITTAALSVLIYNIVQRAMEIVDKIQSGEVPPDIMVISEMLHQIETQQMHTAITVLVIAWIVGIADTYRLSRK